MSACSLTIGNVPQSISARGKFTHSVGVSGELGVVSDVTLIFSGGFV